MKAVGSREPCQALNLTPSPSGYALERITCCLFVPHVGSSHPTLERDNSRPAPPFGPPDCLPRSTTRPAWTSKNTTVDGQDRSVAYRSRGPGTVSRVSARSFPRHHSVYCKERQRITLERKRTRRGTQATHAMVVYGRENSWRGEAPATETSQLALHPHRNSPSRPLLLGRRHYRHGQYLPHRSAPLRTDTAREGAPRPLNALRSTRFPVGLNASRHLARPFDSEPLRADTDSTSTSGPASDSDSTRVRPLQAHRPQLGCETRMRRRAFSPWLQARPFSMQCNCAFATGSSNPRSFMLEPEQRLPRFSTPLGSLTDSILILHFRMRKRYIIPRVRRTAPVRAHQMRELSVCLSAAPSPSRSLGGFALSACSAFATAILAPPQASSHTLMNIVRSVGAVPYAPRSLFSPAALSLQTPTSTLLGHRRIR